MTFGSLRINIPPGADGLQVSSECCGLLSRLWPAPLNFVSQWPHMHTNATGFRAQLTSGGQTRTILDVPHYSFNNQKPHLTVDPVVVKPGDTVSTTCIYRHPGNGVIRFGESTTDEMCFNFVMAWPIPPKMLRTCVR